MRIALLMTEASPWCRELANRLIQHGVDVHIIDFAKPLKGAAYLSASDAFQRKEIQALRERAAGVHHLAWLADSRFRYLASAPQLARICRLTRSDVLLTLYGGGNALAAFTSGVRPYAVYAVGSDILLVRGAIARHVAGRALSAAAVVFANGDYLSRSARSLAPAAHVYPLLLGINVSEFQLRPRANHKTHIICTRGFMSVYANEVIVSALGIVDPALDVEVTFTSAGPTLAEVQRLARTLPLAASRVHFLAGITRSELVTRLETADLYVSMARSDGTSISLLEAMAAGAFPVVTNLEQNREWLASDLGDGELVTIDSAADLAAALERVIVDQARRARAGPRNRRVIETRANANMNTETLIRELEIVAKRSRHAV